MQFSAALLCFLSCVCVPVQSRDVTIGFIKLLSIRGNWRGANNAKSAACAIMAVNHMNARNPVIAPALADLPEGFNVSYLVTDSELTPSVAAARASDLVHQGADAIVGPVMSSAAGPASLISGIYKIPLTAYVSTAPALSDKSTYPYFGRVCMSDSKLVENVIQVCKTLGWSSVSMLYQDDAWGKGIAEAVNTAGGQLDVKVLTSQQFNNDDLESVKSAVTAAAQYGGRIFLFIAGSSAYDTMFFTADDLGIIGRGHVWVAVTGSNPGGIVERSSDPIRMQRVVSGMLSVREQAMYGEKETKLAEVIAAEDPETLYHPALGPKEEVVPVLNGAPGGMCGYIYDATVASGLALAYAAETEEGTLDRDDVHHRLRNTDFEGATGHVQTDPETADRVGSGITMVLYNAVPSFTEENEPTMDSRQIAIFDEGELQQTGVPYWAGGMESWDQIPGDGFQCKDGFALSEETFRCEACPAGSEQRGAVCSPCDIGRHASEEGLVACPKCTEGYANTTGQVECHSCPANTYRPAGTPGESIMECVCNPGTYSRRGAGTPCEECPAGADCDGGTKPPYPHVGFWGERRCEAFGGEVECDEWFEFLECTPHSDCAGGPDFACAPGRAGRLCRETDDGWYNVGRIAFFECEKGGTAIAFIGIVGIVIAWSVIVWLTLYYASIDVLVQFMLVNAMIASFGLKWHSKLNALNILLKIANFEVDFISYHCFGAWEPEHAFFLQLLLPLLVTIVYVAGIAACRAIFKTSGHTLQANGIKIFLSLTITTYHTALYRSFATFRCESYPDGKEYFSLHPNIECWQPTHISMVVVGVLYVAIGGIGVPAFLWNRVDFHRKEGTLQDDEVDFTYGWQHQRYIMKWKNWWAVVCFRRFAVAFIAALVPWSMVQAMATVMVMTALLTAQVMVQPHASHRIDLLEYFSKVMTNCYVLGGMLMYGSITAKAQGRTCAEDATGVDAQFCAQENDIKDGVAIFSLLCMSLTLVFAGFLSFTLAWDEHNSFRASKLLARLHKTGGTKKIKGDKDEQFDHSSMGHILNSVPVLRWITNTEKQDASRQGDAEAGADSVATGHLSAEQFFELEVGLSDMARHFNSAKSVRADILNKVCTTPGLIEWIAVETEGRESMLRFVNGFADFLRREKHNLHKTRSESGNSQEMARAAALTHSDSMDGTMPSPAPMTSRSKRDSLVLSMLDITLQASSPGEGKKKAMFPVSDLIKKEHLGTAAYYMMTCSETNRHSFCRLIDDILHSNFQHISSIRDFARSSSAVNTPLAIVRESSTRHRKLSLDDYRPEACPVQSPRAAGSESPGANRTQARKKSNVASDRGPSSDLYVQAQLVTPRVLPEPGAGIQAELPPTLLRRNGSDSSLASLPAGGAPDPVSLAMDGMMTAREPADRPPAPVALELQAAGTNAGPDYPVLPPVTFGDQQSI